MTANFYLSDHVILPEERLARGLPELTTDEVVDWEREFPRSRSEDADKWESDYAELQRKQNRALQWLQDVMLADISLERVMASVAHDLVIRDTDEFQEARNYIYGRGYEKFYKHSENKK